MSEHRSGCGGLLVLAAVAAYGYFFWFPKEKAREACTKAQLRANWALELPVPVMKKYVDQVGRACAAPKDSGFFLRERDALVAGRRRGPNCMPGGNPVAWKELDLELAALEQSIEASRPGALRFPSAPEAPPPTLLIGLAACHQSDSIAAAIRLGRQASSIADRLSSGSSVTSQLFPDAAMLVEPDGRETARLAARHLTQRARRLLRTIGPDETKVDPSIDLPPLAEPSRP